MRLLTWNVGDLDLTAPDLLEDPRVRLLRRTDADLVCLQKLSGGDPAREGLERLTRYLGTGGTLGLARGDRLHVAVLWREPWRLRRRVADGTGARRNHLVVDLVRAAAAPAASVGLRVASVHLPSSSVDDQLADLDRLLAVTDPGTVLAGDWNATGADPAYDATALPGDDRRVARRLDAAGQADAATLADAPWTPTWGRTLAGRDVRIDAARVGSALADRVSGVHVLLTADGLTLHRPVALDLEIG